MFTSRLAPSAAIGGGDAFSVGSGRPALHYTDEGTGTTIVLVHGWTFSGEVIRHNASALAERHRVVTVDLRGHVVLNA